jgi:hypothetical protein
MVTASDLLRDMWLNYMKSVEIPRIKALLAIKKWSEYEMTVFVFPVNLLAFRTEIEGYARGGGKFNASGVFKKYIIEPKHSGMSIEEFVHKFLDKEFEKHIIKLGCRITEDDADETTVSFVTTFKEIGSVQSLIEDD